MTVHPIEDNGIRRKKLAVVVVGNGVIEDQLPDLKEAALNGREAVRECQNFCVT